jgi:hypothetical protein
MRCAYNILWFVFFFHVHGVNVDSILVDLAPDGFALKYEITDHSFHKLSRDVHKHERLCTSTNA